jgi:HSP20 family molecular chaperone IbpA
MNFVWSVSAFKPARYRVLNMDPDIRPDEPVERIRIDSNFEYPAGTEFSFEPDGTLVCRIKLPGVGAENLSVDLNEAIDAIVVSVVDKGTLAHIPNCGANEKEISASYIDGILEIRAKHVSVRGPNIPIKTA